jgi:hypothetical protein
MMECLMVEVKASHDIMEQMKSSQGKVDAWIEGMKT